MAFMVPVGEGRDVVPGGGEFSINTSHRTQIIPGQERVFNTSSRKVGYSKLIAEE